MDEEEVEAWLTAADRLILLWLIGTPVVFFGGLLAIIFLLPKGTPAPWYW